MIEACGDVTQTYVNAQDEENEDSALKSQLLSAEFSGWIDDVSQVCQFMTWDALVQRRFFADLGLFETGTGVCGWSRRS